MRRRLAAALCAALAMAACSPGERTRSDAPPAPAPPAVSAPVATELIYAASPSPTLAAVRARGRVICGVHPGLPGFAYRDVKGVWRGFDVDVCRAVAAAVLGDAGKVAFKPLDSQTRFTALREGKVDLVSRNTSWSLSRDAGLGLDFAAVTYFDGQGFLAARSLNLSSADELGGARICVQSGTTSQSNLADYFRSRGLSYQPVLVASEAEARNAYQAEACDALSADISALAATRSVLDNPNGHVILPTVISKEPLGPVVRQGDPAWTDIVRWSVFALIAAEELGLNSRTVADSLATASDPATRRFLGLEDNDGALLGLQRDWGLQIVKQVGAYDEVFRRNIGEDSGLRLERGLNALWSSPTPGLLYAPPFR